MTHQYKKSATRDTFESLVVTVILAIFGTTFVVQAFKIPTGSMENTLLIGDHLLVNKFAFAYQSGFMRRLLPYRELHRGDVVVFKFPGEEQAQEPGEHFVKRVIGVPGDRIRIAQRQVFVNGQPLKEPYTNFGNPPDPPLAVDDFPPTDAASSGYMTLRWGADYLNYISRGELTVPSGKYFVMGDHRERSWDSRFWGFVPRELVSGHPLIIYWSFETARDEYEQTSVSERFSQAVDLVFHFFSKTRWRRTFQFVR